MSLRIQSVANVGRTEGVKVSAELSAVPNTMSEVAVEGVSAVQNVKPLKKEQLDYDEVENALESVNDAIEHINRGLRFSLHEGTQRMVVRVVDTATQEIIKEIPPEDVLDKVARIREAIGVLIDELA